MENQTRYDLNAAIEGWRTELAAQPNLTAEVRRELETHLRDAIAGFQERGLNDEESFWLGRRRVGHLPQLEQEFAKADPAAVWRERIFWGFAVMITLQIAGRFSTTLFSIPIQLFKITNHEIFQFIVHRLTYDAPIVWIVALFVGGKLGWLSKLPSFCFGSRLRVGSTLTALLLVSVGLSILSIWRQFILNNPMQRNESSSILYYNLITAVSPLIWIGLMVWLMPPQYRKGEKTA